MHRAALVIMLLVGGVISASRLPASSSPSSWSGGSTQEEVREINEEIRDEGVEHKEEFAEIRAISVPIDEARAEVITWLDITQAMVDIYVKGNDPLVDEDFLETVRANEPDVLIAVNEAARTVAADSLDGMNVMLPLAQAVFQSQLDPAEVYPTDDEQPSVVLHAPAPSPTNSAVNLSFSMLNSGHVRLSIVNVSGRLIASVANGWMEAGSHDVSWNLLDYSGKTVVSGLYFAQLSVGQNVTVRKIVIQD
jgi:hypothetical protein